MSLFNKKTCPVCEQTLKKPMLKIKDNLKICKS